MGGPNGPVDPVNSLRGQGNGCPSPETRELGSITGIWYKWPELASDGRNGLYRLDWQPAHGALMANPGKTHGIY